MPVPPHLRGLDGTPNVPVFAASEFRGGWKAWYGIMQSDTVQEAEGAVGGSRAPGASRLLRGLVEGMVKKGTVDSETCRAYDAQAHKLEEIMDNKRVADGGAPCKDPTRRLYVDAHRDELAELPGYNLTRIFERPIRERPGSRTVTQIMTYRPPDRPLRSGLWEGGMAPHIDGPTTSPGLREKAREPENRACFQVAGDGVLVVGLQVVNEDGFAAEKDGGILCYIEIPISQGDSYVLTEKLAGRMTVAARARGGDFDAVRVVHGVRGVSARRALVTITSRIPGAEE